ncbi:hypothetical protein ACHAXT_009199 [Thalassiosira profunda]
MSRCPNPTTLDLHGCRLEEAISEVTLFLERIRRTVASASRRRSAHQILYVQIITGAGSHSSHGPVLRNAVQRLLEKRGMDFRLERGGGAFQVDALSGVDLYDAGPAVCSKVVVSEHDEFHRAMAARNRGNNAGSSFANAATAMGAMPPPRPPLQRPPRTVSVPAGPPYPYNQSRSDPLPSQVASSDSEMRTAVQTSVNETQRQRSNQARGNREFERQYQRAVSESRIDHAASARKASATESKEQEAIQLAYERSMADEEDRRRRRAAPNNAHAHEMEEEELQLAYEQSIADEESRQTLTEKQFEGALLMAIEASERERYKTPEDERARQYEEALLRAIEQSAQEAEAQKGKSDSPDPEVMEQILAESRALAEAEKANHSEDDLMEKILAESRIEEERRQALEDAVAAQGKSSEDGGPSDEERMLLEVMRISLEQQEEEKAALETAEEEAVREALEVSRRIR